MKISVRKSGLLLAAVCLAGAGAISHVTQADGSAKQTTVTVQSPEQVPGSVLPAGTYVFKQSGARSGWTIVQVYSNDGASLVTTILAYPNRKVASNGSNVVTYPANGSGSIPAMEGVIFTGDSTVEQFAYPKVVADQIGAANHTRIPTTGTDDAYPSALPDATSSWSSPVTNDATTSAPATTDATLSAANTTDATQQPLPKTASPLPLIALIGLFSIGGIVALRKLTRGSAS